MTYAKGVILFYAPLECVCAEPLTRVGITAVLLALFGCQVVANNKEDTLAKLSPANVSGSLMVCSCRKCPPTRKCLCVHAHTRLRVWRVILNPIILCAGSCGPDPPHEHGGVFPPHISKTSDGQTDRRTHWGSVGVG